MCLLDNLLLLDFLLFTLSFAHLLTLFHLVEVLVLELLLYASFVQTLSARVVIIRLIYDVLWLAWTASSWISNGLVIIT